MSGAETRSNSRDSLFLMANMQVENDSTHHRVKVRNLSSMGMMGEARFRVTRGMRLTIELQRAGSVRGSVAWVQDERFGIAFDEAIDPALLKDIAA